MKPKISRQQNRQANLFRPEFVSMINPSYSLVRLSKVVDWEKLNETFVESFCPEKGRSAISTRLMVALHYFKYTFDLSDEDVLHSLVENPYWQYFSGMKHFEHKMQ